MSMTTTNTNTNTNANAPVAALDDDCSTAYATRADLLSLYITLEEALKERQEEERNEQRRAKWGDRLQSAQHRAHKHVRVALKVETDTVRAAAMRARLRSSLASFFLPEEELEVSQVTRLAPLVEECLDDVRERALQRWWVPLAQHWKKCLPKGILSSAAMQPYLRSLAATDAAAAVEATAP
jgi:hypothetical protein